MSAIAGHDRRIARRRNHARTAFLLSMTSGLLLAVGFLWLGFAFGLAPVVAIAALAYGVLSLRRPREARSTAMAAVGIVFSVLALFAFLSLLVAFVLNPPE
jgi:hypothetical protein